MTDQRIERIRQRCLTDLSFLARKVLGMDYFKDESSGEIVREIEWDGKLRPCGVVDYGPHGEMIAFLNGDEKLKLLMASRGAFKTSIVQAKIIQDILRNPDIRIFVGMETYGNALQMVRTIKGHFEQNEKLRQLFGNWVGNEKWTDSGFIVSKRRNRALRDPTLQAFGTDKIITGGHCDRIYYDDPVSWQQALSAQQMNKSIVCYQQLQPILDPGGQIVVTCTPYDEQDLSHWMRRELGSQLATCVLDCGMEAVADGAGGFALEGEPRFPHHNQRYLMDRLAAMGPSAFNSQYALRTMNPEDQLFFRDQFITEPWQDRFTRLNAYVLTDTAVSDSDTACFSVVAVVTLDWDDTAYLLDLRVGRWKPDDYVREFVQTVQEWSSKLRIVGMTMENVSMNRVYRTTLENRLRNAGLPTNFISIPRGVSEPSKRMRIRGLESRFASGKFRVVETVPAMFSDGGREKPLFNPTGFKGKDGRQPDGELVRQFINFRFTGGAMSRVDIPDALADLEACNSQGRRYVLPSPKPMYAATTGERSQLATRGGRLPIAPPRRSFWKEMSRRIQ